MLPLNTGRLRKLGTGHGLFILGYFQYESSKSKYISLKSSLLAVIYFLFHPNQLRAFEDTILFPKICGFLFFHG